MSYAEKAYSWRDCHDVYQHVLTIHWFFWAKSDVSNDVPLNWTDSSIMLLLAQNRSRWGRELWGNGRENQAEWKETKNLEWQKFVGCREKVEVKVNQLRIKLSIIFYMHMNFDFFLEINFIQLRIFYKCNVFIKMFILWKK